jgi:hypothetical protein
MPLVRLGASGGLLGVSDGVFLEVGGLGFRCLPRLLPGDPTRALDSGLWMAVYGLLSFVQTIAGRDRTVRRVLNGKAGFRFAFNHFRILQNKPSVIGAVMELRGVMGGCFRNGKQPLCLAPPQDTGARPPFPGPVVWLLLAIFHLFTPYELLWPKRAFPYFWVMKNSLSDRVSSRAQKAETHARCTGQIWSARDESPFTLRSVTAGAPPSTGTG